MRSDLYTKSVELLKGLISIPSFSREEDKTADLLQQFLQAEGIEVKRTGNNIWAVNRFFDSGKPSVLLNSHHDTVKPNPQYTRDPFQPATEGNRLYGLGSNDAGGALVSLIATFIHYYPNPDLRHNVVLAATAEEEISGTGGIESIWDSLPPIDFAIVGEPTLSKIAVAEKGLMVLDCIARGKAGHAAREEGVNAIYEALDDIDWFMSYRFPEISPVLGPVKMTVTVINAGKQHNVVPAECHFTVDVRATEKYSLEELLEVIRSNVKCEVKPRSMRMRPSGITPGHPLVAAAQKLGIEQYGSPTTSDQALIPVPSVKMGPGDSARSHTADEFIFIDEIEKGISAYIALLDEVIR